MTAQIELICSDCGHSFQIATETALRPEQKCCPECHSEFIRQTFSSYLRNGPLSNPECGAPGCTATYG